MPLHITLSDSVLEKVLILQALEEWRSGNYTRIDEQVDKMRYRVNDLIMGAVFAELHHQQKQPKLNLTEWAL
jgi:hypothetical protein